MTTISVRLDPELKKEMEKFPHLNWSEVIRNSIKNTLSNERERNLAKAVLLNERVRKKLPGNIDSTEIIRKMRDERH